MSGLVIAYDGRTIVTGLDLAVLPTEIVAVLGPSGCGKSSVLRCIAGVQSPQAGTIGWNGSDVTRVPAHLRRIGLVFQDPLLFPHRDVAGNVGFALPGRSSRDSAARHERVRELLDLVGLPGFESRHITTLSGGEAQRVALARALAPRPHLLLLDEPFGALDRDLRDRLAVDVRALLERERTPALHVTHDRAETDLIASRVIHFTAAPA
ncbi:MAG: ABC transporter ATP-binding protein [Candidatus Nanopelagicales bacterium]